MGSDKLGRARRGKVGGCVCVRGRRDIRGERWVYSRGKEEEGDGRRGGKRRREREWKEEGGDIGEWKRLEKK